MAVDLQIAVANADLTVSNERIEFWVNETLKITGQPQKDLTVRLVEESEIQQLNRDYRNKDKPTNVLSFSFEDVPEVECEYLGDIVICMDVVRNESAQQDKAFESHFAHMVIHGTLHLCGYDHQTDDEAEVMESLENALLKEMLLVPDSPQS
jgi:probable rRNA maturation factor